MGYASVSAVQGRTYAWRCFLLSCTGPVHSGTRRCRLNGSPTGPRTRRSWTLVVDEGFIVLGGPLDDEFRIIHAIVAASADAVRATLARDPWSETHLQLESVTPWTIRLDGR